MRARPGDQQQNLPPRAGNAPAQTAASVVQTPSGETAEVLSSAPAPKIFDDQTGARDGLVRGSAVDEEGEPAEPPREVLRYVVLREALYTDNGHRVRLPLGKVIDSNNYDIKRVIRAGVRLKQLAPGQDSADVLEAQMSTGAV